MTLCPCKHLLILPATIPPSCFIGPRPFTYNHDHTYARITFISHSAAIHLLHAYPYRTSLGYLLSKPTHGACPPSQSSVIDELILGLSRGLRAEEKRLLAQSLSDS